MKTKVLSFIRDMKTYNVGQYMTNRGLILASIGVVSALIGSRIRINTVDDRVIIGGEKLENLSFHMNHTPFIKEDVFFATATESLSFHKGNPHIQESHR